MHKELTPEVWFGDKPSVAETNGEVKAIINVAHSIKHPYWRDVGRLPWDVWYFRIAKPDGKEADLGYLRLLSSVVDEIKATDMLPVLVHCRAGGHRGPCGALFVAWHLAGRQGFDALYDTVLGLVPSLRGFNRAYHKSIVRYCRECEDQYEFRKQATA